MTRLKKYPRMDAVIQGGLMFVPSCSDVENHILSFLTPEDLCRSTLVNKKWRIRASHNSLWSRFFLKNRFSPEKSIKAHYDLRGIISLNALIKRVHEFSKKVKQKENGELFCYFPEQTRCYFSAKILNNDKNDKFGIRECYWFLGDLSLEKIIIRDVITIGDNHNYIVHTRLPKNPEIRKKSDRIVAIIGSRASDNAEKIELNNKQKSKSKSKSKHRPFNIAT